MASELARSELRRAVARAAPERLEVAGSLDALITYDERQADAPVPPAWSCEHRPDPRVRLPL